MMNRKQILAFLSMIILTILMIPRLQVHASSVIENFPTSTSVIVAGWNNPTNAYALDDAWVDTDVDGAEQEYGDFAFNLNATDVVEKVWVRTRFYDYMGVDSANPDGDIRFSLKVWNGSAWTTYQVADMQLNFFDPTGDGSAGDSLSVPVSSGMASFDVSAVLDTVSKLNGVKVRVLVAIQGGLTPSYFGIGFDAVSVEVAYTTPSHEKSWFTAGTYILILPISFMAIIAFAIILKKKR